MDMATDERCLARFGAPNEMQIYHILSCEKCDDGNTSKAIKKGKDSVHARYKIK